MDKNKILYVYINSIMLLIRALSLFIVLYGNNINGALYIKTCCKVFPVSIILPFKIGELYGIYCYGYLANDKFGYNLDIPSENDKYKKIFRQKVQANGFDYYIDNLYKVLTLY